jgi:hypothetical protein
LPGLFLIWSDGEPHSLRAESAIAAAKDGTALYAIRIDRATLTQSDLANFRLALSRFAPIFPIPFPPADLADRRRPARVGERQTGTVAERKTN